LKREQMEDSDLYFAMRVINQLRPCLDTGTFSPDLAHLLILSEEQVEVGCSILRSRFNLNEKQQDMVSFAQFVFDLHRNKMDYETVWKANGSPNGMVVMHVLIDDYNNQAGWEYMVLHPGNIQTVDVSEDYRQHVMKLMQINSPDVMLVCFVDQTRSEKHNSNFMMEIWHLLPKRGLAGQTDQMANLCSAVFASSREKPFDMEKHSELVMQLVRFDRTEIIRAAVEQHSINQPLFPSDLDWNQFIIRIWDVLTKMSNEGFHQTIMADQEDNETTIMWFRMLEGPEAAEFHYSYGPITRLTKPIVEQTLNDLREASQGDENQYEISLYERHLQTLNEHDDGGLHYFFTHEQWMDHHQCPFVCLWKVPEASYQQGNDVLELIKSILGVHDPVSMTSKDRTEATRSGEFFQTPEELLVRAYETLPDGEKGAHYDDLFAFLITCQRYANAYEKSGELKAHADLREGPVLVNVQLDAERHTGKLAIGIMTVQQLHKMLESENTETWAQHYLPRLTSLEDDQMILLFTDDEMSARYGFPFDIMFIQ
jgi:hypothetical protein